MRESEEKIKGFPCSSISHHKNPNDIPLWQLRQYENEDGLYLAAREYYLAEDSTTKQNTEAEKAKREFDVLVKEWKEATAHFSSERQQIGHLSFLKIAVLGKKALPLILDEFRREPIPGWLSILEAFAGNDVASNATTYKEAIECWINWGKANGYLKA